MFSLRPKLHEIEKKRVLTSVAARNRHQVIAIVQIRLNFRGKLGRDRPSRQRVMAGVSDIMSTHNPSSDSPASISVAELRRRLLASTPPPLAASAAEPASVPVPEEPASPTPPSAHAAADLLHRLRMPGGAVARPQAEDPQVVRPSVTRRTPVPTNARFEAFNPLADPIGEVHRLRAENKELRALLEEMKQLLQEASEAEAKFVEHEKELSAALEEKTRQVEELSSQLQAIEEQIANGELAPPPPTPKTRTELEEWADELEKENAKLAQERRQLEQERQQLREDEEALEQQMREMEVSMARERALLARQETELKRLSAEIQHELELMQRGDATLREQMAKFQRRAQEVMSSRPPGPPTNFRR